LKLFLGENGLYVWGWQGQAEAGWVRLGQAGAGCRQKRMS